MANSDEDEVLKYFANIRPRKEDKGAFWMGVIFVLAASAFPGYQSFLWLQSGAWTPWPISSLIHTPTVEWLGVQKIIAWLFDLPVWSIPAVLAYGCFSEWWQTAPKT